MIKKISIIIFLGVLLVFFSVVGYGLLLQRQVGLEIIFLDIGQGDATLIKTPFGQNILIDGGPDSAVLKRLGKNLPWWDKKIDLMILTHPHDDHIVGLNEVIRIYDVQMIIYTGIIYDSPAYENWQELVKKYQISTIVVDRPQIINLGDNCDLEILYPRQAIYGQGIDNLNNSSIASRLICEGTKILLMGDAEREEEKELLATNIDLSTDILKVGHHGSDTASSQEFLDKVQPKYAVIEVGENNFGLPSLRVIKRLERSGAVVYRTDQNGAIKVKKDSQNVIILFEK